MPQTFVVQGASRGIGLELTRQLLERGAQVLATSRQPHSSPGLLQLSEAHKTLVLAPLDVEEEATIERAAATCEAEFGRVHGLVNASGILHASGIAPEKHLRHVDPEVMARVFRVNAFGPLLVTKHFSPLMRHDERAVLANISARVGSISDNRAGGWYAYRASKAAQNMFTVTAAIELKRRAPRLVVIALHPGTVETDLSEPFRRGVAPERLFSVQRAGRQLLGVIDGVTARDSGRFFAWDGQEIPW